MAVYVYSVVGAEHPRRLDGLRGVGEAPESVLRGVTAGPLCAVVGDAPDGLRPGRADIEAHHAVQVRLMADGAVLPLRFGLVTGDDDAVRAVLKEHAVAWTELLSTLAGSEEYHLNAAQDEEILLRRILAESSTARHLSENIRAGVAADGAPLRLGELVAREVRARQEALAMGVIEALRPFARGVDSTRPTGADFLSVSFLVPEDQEETFLTTELSVAHQLGDDLDFRLHGPLPPYSFV
ncbi:GvpL/GvpF family gas vesicle protein [Streptomyces sp. NPDC026659]|uniref:GvpL/GvpF family gas vesicle protein n=1 Tax=Streptomyces sp. NPDC026659 TaxID=3155123 RepID=UPI0033D6F2EF